MSVVDVLRLPSDKLPTEYPWKEALRIYGKQFAIFLASVVVGLLLIAIAFIGNWLSMKIGMWAGIALSVVVLSYTMLWKTVKTIESKVRHLESLQKYADTKTEGFDKNAGEASVNQEALLYEQIKVLETRVEVLEKELEFRAILEKVRASNDKVAPFVFNRSSKSVASDLAWFRRTTPLWSREKEPDQNMNTKWKSESLLMASINQEGKAVLQYWTDDGWKEIVTNEDIEDKDVTSNVSK